MYEICLGLGYAPKMSRKTIFYFSISKFTSSLLFLSRFNYIYQVLTSKWIKSKKEYVSYSFWVTSQKDVLPIFFPNLKRFNIKLARNRTSYFSLYILFQSQMFCFITYTWNELWKETCKVQFIEATVGSWWNIYEATDSKTIGFCFMIHTIVKYTEDAVTAK